MSSKLTAEYVKSWIKGSLGGSLRSIELADSDYVMVSDNALDRINEVIKRRTYRVETGVESPISTNTSFQIELDDDVVDVLDVNYISTANVSVLNTLFSGIPLRKTIPAEMIDIAMIKQHHKTFLRQTGAGFDWEYDVDSHTLHIYAPANPYYICIHEARNYSDPAELKTDHDQLFLKLCLRYAKEVLGRIRSKFGDEIPGPAGTTKLDGSTLIAEAKDEEEKLSEKLRLLRDSQCIVIG